MSNTLSDKIITDDYFKDVETLQYHLKCVDRLQSRLFSVDLDLTKYKSVGGLPQFPTDIITKNQEG
jgi:hypothetical protein